MYMGSDKGLGRLQLLQEGSHIGYGFGRIGMILLRQGRDSVSLRQLDRSPRKYDILFYQRHDGSYVLHRVRAVTPEGLILWGDNQYRLEYGVQNAQIIGYAARIFRDDREVDIDGLVYRLWLWLWQYRPMRRVLLPIVYHLRKVKFYAEN